MTSTTPNQRPDRVLVVDDDARIRDLLRRYLSQEGFEVLLAEDAKALNRLLTRETIDMIILDLMLPGEDGLSLCKRLRTRSQVPIIMLTARAQEQDKVEGLDAGADDYITKPFSPKELMARIKAVLRRRAPHLTDDLIEVSGLALDPGSHRVTAGEAEIALGPTEFKMLHFFMTHPERVYTRMQVLDHVWGDHVFVEERTVDVHIRRLRQALEPTGHDSLIETVRGAGYRFRG